MVAQLGNDPSALEHYKQQQQLALDSMNADQQKLATEQMALDQKILAVQQQAVPDPQPQLALAQQQQQIHAAQQQLATAAAEARIVVSAAEQQLAHLALRHTPTLVSTIPTIPTIPTAVGASSAMVRSASAAAGRGHDDGRDDVDLVSEDSLTVSPDKLKPYARSGARSASGSRATRKAAGVVKPISLRSRSMTPTRDQRLKPPLAPAKIQRPIAVPDTSGTLEGRVAAMEVQRAADHKVLNAMADAILGVRADAQQLNADFQALTQSGMELRHQVSAARAEVTTGLTGAQDAAQNAAMAQMAISVESKFAIMDAVTTELLATVNALGRREQMVEAVMEKQVANNEAIVGDAFMKMEAKIGMVASLAKTFDGTQLAASGHSLVPYTQAIDNDVNASKSEFAAMPGHVTAEILKIVVPLNVMNTEQRVISIQHEENIVTLESKMVALEVMVTTLNSLVPSAAQPPGLFGQCGVCTPSAPLSSWSHSPPVVSGAPGQAGPSGPSSEAILRAVIGGNNACHCIHVSELITRVDKLEAAGLKAQDNDPLQADSWGHPKHGGAGAQGWAGQSGGGGPPGHGGGYGGGPPGGSWLPGAGPSGAGNTPGGLCGV